MHRKLAGQTPLQDLIDSTLGNARAKLAAAEGKDQGEKEKEKKLLNYEKKEHGHLPSVAEEKAEKKASAGFINVSDFSEVEKLASACEFLGEKLASDSVELGGESKQGGEVLVTQNKTTGTQPYSKDGSKKHQPPMNPGTEAPKDNPGASTAMATDEKRAPGGTGVTYPANGPLRKTASEDIAMRIQMAKEAGIGQLAMKHPRAAGALALGGASAASGVFPGAAGGAAAQEKGKRLKGAGKGALAGAAYGAAAGGAMGLGLGHLAKKGIQAAATKHASARPSEELVDFLMAKMAESEQGGMVLTDDKVSAPVPANPGRELIGSNTAPVSATKAQAKAPVKKPLSEVLTEPAMSKATDNKVHENLRNASKGGVKIAAAREALLKIASDGCQCNDKGECKYCKLKAASKAQAAK